MTWEVMGGLRRLGGVWAARRVRRLVCSLAETTSVRSARIVDDS